MIEYDWNKYSLKRHVLEIPGPAGEFDLFRMMSMLDSLGDPRPFFTELLSRGPTFFYLCQLMSVFVSEIQRGNSFHGTFSKKRGGKPGPSKAFG